MRDPRHSAGKWYKLRVRLTLIFLAILSGEQDMRGIAEGIGEQRWRLGPVFKLKNCRLPSDGPIRRVLGVVNLEALEGRLGQWA